MLCDLHIENNRLVQQSSCSLNSFNSNDQKFVCSLLPCHLDHFYIYYHQLIVWSLVKFGKKHEPASFSKTTKLHFSFGLAQFARAFLKNSLVHVFPKRISGIKLEALLVNFKFTLLVFSVFS